jgi:hypothetical protein
VYSRIDYVRLTTIAPTNLPFVFWCVGQQETDQVDKYYCATCKQWAQNLLKKSGEAEVARERVVDEDDVLGIKSEKQKKKRGRPRKNKPPTDATSAAAAAWGANVSEDDGGGDECPPASPKKLAVKSRSTITASAGATAARFADPNLAATAAAAGRAFALMQPTPDAVASVKRGMVPKKDIVGKKEIAAVKREKKAGTPKKNSSKTLASVSKKFAPLEPQLEIKPYPELVGAPMPKPPTPEPAPPCGRPGCERWVELAPPLVGIFWVWRCPSRTCMPVVFTLTPPKFSWFCPLLNSYG